MTYEQEFIDACLRSEATKQLIRKNYLHVDAEDQTLSFDNTSKKIRLLPFSVDGGTDGELFIMYGRYKAVFLLDGIAHYGDTKRLKQTVDIFAMLIKTFFEESGKIELYSLWGISRIQVQTTKGTYLSMPFDETSSIREVGQLIPIISFGKKTTIE